MLSFATLYIVWGTTYLGIRFAVDSLPPMLMGAARFLVAGAILYPVMRVSGNPRPEPVHWRSALIVGAFLMLGGQGSVAWAEQRIPSGLAAALVATMPLWMLVVNWARPRGQTPDARLVIGILAGFAGVVLLVAPWQTSARDVDIWGILAVIGGALAWAVGSLYSTTARLPRSHLMATAMQMLADYYGRPGGCHGGKTDACLPGAQAGMEKALSIMYPILAGATGVGTLGHVENAVTFSFEQLVIDDAIAGYIRRMLSGFEVNAETLAFDVIKEVGIGGNFLSHPHTAASFRREFYLPDIVERLPWAAWEAEPVRGMEAKAREKAASILRDHHPEPLDAAQVREIDRIVEAAEQDPAFRR